MRSIDAQRIELLTRLPRPVSSTKRISRFPGFRRILRFPAYPMAPLPIRHWANQIASTDHDPVVNRPALVSGQYPSFLSSRQHHQLATVGGMRDRDSASNKAAGDLIGRSAIPGVRWRSTAIASQQQVALSRANSFASAAVVPNTSIPAVGPDGAYARRTRSDIGTEWVHRSGAKSGVPALFHPTSPASGGLAEIGPWRPPVGGEQFDPSSRDRTEGPLRHQVELKRNLQVRDGFVLNGSNQTPGEDGSRSNRLRCSTLHLDGSALGRWAVDHLQRTLSRPATGMTGVDPRATPPQSRVSPF